MKGHISIVNWSYLLGNLDPNSQYEYFLSVYNEACSLAITFKSFVYRKKRAIWINEKVLALVKQKKLLWYQNVASSWKDADKINDYKKIRRKVIKATKKR